LVFRLKLWIPLGIIKANTSKKGNNRVDISNMVVSIKGTGYFTTTKEVINAPLNASHKDLITKYSVAILL